MVAWPANVRSQSSVPVGPKRATKASCVLAEVAVAVAAPPPNVAVARNDPATTVSPAGSVATALA